MLRMIDCRAGGERDVDLAELAQGDVWVARGGERLTREEFARVAQNTTTPIIVAPAEVRWYERSVDE